MDYFEYIIALLAPHLCLGCGVEGVLYCSGCVASITRADASCYRCARRIKTGNLCDRCAHQGPIQKLVVATDYADDAKRLVHALKFERARMAAQPIAEIMVSRLQGINLDGLTVVPVPTATARVRQRGYDQAACVAKRIAKELGVPCQPLLARSGQQRQLGQDRRHRQQQLTEAFRLKRQPSTKRVLLVDDVITTGSTIEAAASVLGAAGITNIEAAVFASA